MQSRMNLSVAIAVSWPELSCFSASTAIEPVSFEPTRLAFSVFVRLPNIDRFTDGLFIYA